MQLFLAYTVIFAHQHIHAHIAYPMHYYGENQNNKMVKHASVKILLLYDKLKVKSRSWSESKKSKKNDSNIQL